MLVLFHLPQSDQYVIINHNLTQSPDKFRIIDERNGSSTPLSFSNNNNGDWYFDSDSKNLSYISKTHFEKITKQSLIKNAKHDLITAV